MQAVILAAGKSSRFRADGQNHKLLTPFFGIPILQRTLLSARYAGIKEFVIVTGFDENKIKKLLGNGSRFGVKIKYVFNKHFYKENGLSVLAAKQEVNSPFALLMGDDVFDPHILKEMLTTRQFNNESLLAVDYQLDKIFDLPEATKVKTDKECYIIKIGKQIQSYNAADTGIFILDKMVFNALEEAIKQGKDKLADGIEILASWKKIKVFDVKGKYWVDVDTFSDFIVAQQTVYNQIARGKSTDGYIAHYINRFFSTRITAVLAKLGLSPNFITLISFSLALLGAFLFLIPSRVMMITAGCIVQLASIIDGCDGEISRLRMSMSAYGAWMDTLLDRYADVFILLTLGYTFLLSHPNLFTYLVIVFSVAGTILTSYSTKEYKIDFGKDFEYPNRLSKTIDYLSRDVRVFIIFIGALLNQLFLSVIFIAAITNIQTVIRLVYQYPKREYLK
jgi:CDP-L-myo-inositol myo-inositolphosphotransferase